MTTFAPGYSESKPYLFDAAVISAFAAAAGDLNPLHHDLAVASASRFKGLIASGAQMSAVLMAYGASIISRDHESVGLEFTFRFARAVPAGTATILAWTITGAEPHAGLGGTLLSFTGQIVGEDGTRYVSSSGKAVVWDKPGHSG
jgi:3-hydroxybutyryl-CoA dehydratase